MEVRQQIPSNLAKLSMVGAKTKDKKSSSVRPTISSPLQGAGQLPRGSSQQLLPFKLSEQTDQRKSSGSPKQGQAYQKLSSSSFAEEMAGREAGNHAHARTGSSPAAVTGRALSNMLPKAVIDRPVSPETGQDKTAALKEIQKVNYTDSGEEVFFF